MSKTIYITLILIICFACQAFAQDPYITGATRDRENTTLTVTFSEAVFNTTGGSGALEASDFALSISGGTATVAVTPSSISGSGAVYTLGLSLTGSPDGLELLSVVPSSSTAIYDADDNAASTSQSNNSVYLHYCTASLSLGNAASGNVSLADEGTVYGWGYLWDIQATKKLKGAYSGTTYLGDDSSNKIAQLARGGNAYAALAKDGTVYTWGLNPSGGLGDGTTTDRTDPVRVLMGAYAGTTYLGDNPSNKIVRINCGIESMAAIAEDGTVYSWGRNNYGQLGDATDTDRWTPVRVLKGLYSGTTYLGDDGGNQIIALSFGSRAIAALAENGTMYTWGQNSYGMLGDGTQDDRWTPVRVLKGAYSGTTYLGDNSSNKIIDISVGFIDFMSAVAEDGLVYSWGRGFRGQLGNGTNGDVWTPRKALKGDYSGTT